MFYHSLLPLLVLLCLFSTGGQLQEPFVMCLLRLIPPMPHANSFFFYILLGTFFYSLVHVMCFFQQSSLLQTCAHQYTHIALLQDTLGSNQNGLNIEGYACWDAILLYKA